ncbi:MAG: ABC transporter permease [Vicinamibacterales bacterium]|nr:ABC transporter permease [Vicinamibacterales bacterium]
MFGWLNDLRVSARLLGKTPGFTAAAVIVLGLGIGLNAGMFSLVHALAFAARPFPEPDRLAQLYVRDTRATGSGYRPFSYPVYQALAARKDLFEGVLAHNPSLVGIGDGDESRRTFAVVVSQNYFDVLGAPIVEGRGFTAEESRAGQDLPVVVATHAYWQRTGFDPALIGSTIRVNERPFTVVGRTAPGFTGTMSVFGPELFFPLGVFDSLAMELPGEAARTLGRSDANNLFLVARLRDGVSSTAAGEGLALFGESLTRTFPAEHANHALSLGPLPKFGTSTSPQNEDVITTLGLVLLGMTGAVLLTVCLNLASMLLARGRGRRKEFAIRLALGGSRARIVRQLLIEGMLLSLAGGTLGIGLGLYGIDTLTASLARLLPIAITLDATVSPALIVATLIFAVLATLGFALGPALKHSRTDILSDLKAQPGDDAAPRRARFVPRNPLVAAQVALSLGLLIAAGLFMHMAIGATFVDLGFRADDTVLAEVDSRMGGLDEAQSLDVYARVEARLRALPGVQTASIGAIVPLGTTNITPGVRRAGVNPPAGEQPSTPEAGQAFNAPWNAVGETYFEAMGIRLLQGRTFTRAETYGQGAPPVVILDEVLAARLWPDGDALGQRVQWVDREPGAKGAGLELEVVGIVSRTQRELFENTPRGTVYEPFAQNFMSNAFFHVRPVQALPTLVDDVRREVRATAPGVPLFSVRTFAGHVDASAEYWAMRMSSAMFGLFGGLAMVVALIGLYGVTAHTVARRTKEIGVRMAVGASAGAVRRMVLVESLKTTAVGIAVGWLLGLGVGQVLAALFVDLAAFVPWIFALVPAGFLLASVVATWGPARRATRVNPVTALRAE